MATPKTAPPGSNISSVTAALRYGRGPGARRLMEEGGLPKVTGADGRWRPLLDGGLELVDRKGRSSGWALVPLPQGVGLTDGE